MTIYKLGCNWGKGKPSFYNFIKDEGIVIGANDQLYSIGDLVIVTEGFTVKAIAKVLFRPLSVESNPKFIIPFKQYQIDYDDWINYAPALWYELANTEIFTYELQMGIRKVQQQAIKDKVNDLWNSFTKSEEYYKQKTNVMIKYKTTFMSENEFYTPLNTILYGPPGTGKTFDTIRKAIEIVSPAFEFKDENGEEKDRKLIKDEYQKFHDEGLIGFITFHQSMCYEDFIEGLKPKVNDEDKSEVEYKIEPGLFKLLCSNAAYLCYKNSKQSCGDQTKGKIDFDALYEAFLEDIQARLDKMEEVSFTTLRGVTIIVKRVNRNDSLITQGKNSIRKKEGAPKTKANFMKLYNAFGSADEIKSLHQIKEVLRIQPGISGFYAVFAGLKEFEKSFTPKDDESNDSIDDLQEDRIVEQFEDGLYDDSVVSFSDSTQPVVLIIDEINRGNVAAVFGELITLIEQDKRWGSSVERLKVKLPYSKRDFYVPANLYIIGTMNTADRSVEALDSALRRRFEFEHIAPNAKLLNQTSDGIDLTRLLETINERLSIIKDNDHLIGHAWLWNVKSTEDLKCVYSNRILPLLQEYFYNDYEKLGLVLGDNFFSKPEKANISYLAPFKTAANLANQYNQWIYKLKAAEDLTKEDFISIYTNRGLTSDEDED